MGPQLQEIYERFQLEGFDLEISGVLLIGDFIVITLEIKIKFHNFRIEK